MWNRLLILSFLFVLLSGCRSKRPVSTPALPDQTSLDMTQERFQAQLEQAAGPWNTLMFKASGQLKMGGIDQRFKMEVRMVRDSIIWIDLSEPNLGLRVMRAVLMPDSVAYYSGLLKKADAGSFQKFTRLLGANISFEMLQAAFTAAPAFYPEPAKSRLTTLVTSYLLSGPNDLVMPGTPMGVELEMAAGVRRLMRQEVRTKQDRLEALYTGQAAIQDFPFPERINILIRGKQPVDLDLEVKEIQRDVALRLPFNYPTNYEPFNF
jgi:hypothetical protein